ncbi:MAG: hypothetical protein R3B07_28750 [Polyangiaceae bacterium]
MSKPSDAEGGVTHATSQRVQTTVGTPYGDVDIDELEAAKGWDSGWGLLAGAAAECGVGTSNESNPLIYSQVSIRPWDPQGGASNPQASTLYPGLTGESAWFVFAGRRTASNELLMGSCQDQIAHQEALLCIADKLAEAADTVKPIVWQGPSEYSPAQWGALATTWTIPPQQDKDKFILRDHAINVLAHLARLSQERFVGATFSEGTCDEALVHAAADQAYASTNRGSLFGATNDTYPYPPYLPRSGLDTTVNGREVAAAYLQFEAHILRGASRLLKKLIDESVEADAAGAEVQRAQAGDPKRSAERAEVLKLIG